MTDNVIDILFESASKPRPWTAEFEKLTNQRKIKLEALKKEYTLKIQKLKDQKRDAIEKTSGDQAKDRIRNSYNIKINDVKEDYYKKREAIKKDFAKKAEAIKAKFKKLNESQQLSQQDQDKQEFWLPPSFWLDQSIGHNSKENSSRCRTYLSDEAECNVVERGGKQYLHLQCSKDDFENLFNNLSGSLKWSYIAKKLNSDKTEVQDPEFYSRYHSE